MTKSDLKIETRVDGVEIFLPHRDLGDVAKSGWYAIGAGAFFSVFALFWICIPVSWGMDVIRQKEGPLWVGLLSVIFGCLGLIGLYFVSRLILMGLAMLRNRTFCSIRIDRNSVICFEHFGWLKNQSKVNRSDLENLFVLPLDAALDRDSVGESLKLSQAIFAGLLFPTTKLGSAITTAKLSGSIIAMAYEEDLLTEVVSLVVYELNREGSSTSSLNDFPSSPQSRTVHSQYSSFDVDNTTEGNSSARQNDVTVSVLSETQLRDNEVELPTMSKLEVVETGGETVFRIPQQGLLYGSLGVFGFAVLWNGFMTFVTLAILVKVLVEGVGADEHGSMWTILGLMILFWVVGIGLLIGSVYLAKQSALISVNEGLLIIEHKTIFGTKWTEFAKEEIAFIEMAQSGMEVNDVPVMNLKIQLREGKPVSMFSQLSNAELQWLAQQLRRALSLDFADQIEAYDPDKPIETHAATDIHVEHAANATTIFVPPHSPQGMSAFLVLGILLSGGPLPTFIVCSILFGFDSFFLMVALAITGVGITFFLIHRYITTKHFNIDVTEDQVVIEVRGFLSNRDVSIQRGDLRSIDVEDSSVEINSKKLRCLKLATSKGKNASIMTGRNEEELVYVARLIHQGLKLGQQ